MPHDDMTADDVLTLIRQHLPAATDLDKNSDLEVGFILYDAFAVGGFYDDYGQGNWGFGVAVGGKAMVSEVFGQRLSIRGTRDQVREALQTIDRYARLRLGSEYLEAYEAAYAAEGS